MDITTRFQIVFLCAASVAAAPPLRTDRHMIAELGGPNTRAEVAFSPDGKWLLATACEEGAKFASVVTKWDVRTGKALARFPFQRDIPVFKLAVSPSGKAFAASDSRGKVFVCDSTTGKIRCSYKQSENDGWTVALLTFLDEDHVFSVDGDGIGLKRNTRDKDTKIYRIGKPSELGAVTLSPRGRLLAFTDKSHLHLRGMDLGRDLLSLDLDLGGGRGFAVTDDGAYAMASDDSTGLLLYDLKGEKLIVGWQGHDSVERKKPARKGGVIYMIPDPKTKKIVEWRQVQEGEEVADDEKFRIVNPQTGNALVLRKIPDSEKGEDFVNCVVQIAALPGRNVFVTSDRLGFIRFWNAKGKRLAEVRRHPRSVSTLAVSPDGKILATSGTDQPIVLWDLEKILQAGDGAK